MTVCERYRQPWNAGEVNRLWNEYEIKQLPILQIAKLHKRGEYAILHKLASEGAILETWSDVKGWALPTGKPQVFFSDDVPVKVNNKNVCNTQVESNDECDVESLEDNDDPNDEDYIYESDEDDEEYSVVDSEEDECSVDGGVASDSDSDYQDDASSVNSDSDYEDETENEEFDAYSIKQKGRFIHTIISALKFFVYAA